MKMNRRNLITALSVVGTTSALKAWQTPIVNVVILPAHAQTSTLSYGNLNAPRIGFFGNEGISLSNIAICATVNGDTVTVSLQGRGNILLRSGDLNIDGTFALLGVVGVSPNCTITDPFPPSGLPLRARITAIDSETITVDADDRVFGSGSPFFGFSVTAPAGPCETFPALTGSNGNLCD